MSQKELERLALMKRIEERRTTQRVVAEQLGMSLRQVERLYRRIAQRDPKLFVLWQLGVQPDAGSQEPNEARVSRPVL